LWGERGRPFNISARQINWHKGSYCRFLFSLTKKGGKRGDSIKSQTSSSGRDERKKGLKCRTPPNRRHKRGEAPLNSYPRYKGPPEPGAREGESRKNLQFFFKQARKKREGEVRFLSIRQRGEWRKRESNLFLSNRGEGGYSLSSAPYRKGEKKTFQRGKRG